VKSSRRKEESTPAQSSGLSRREFARGAGVAAAAMAAIPGSVLEVAAGSVREVPLAGPQGAAGTGPKLSAEAQAEAAAKTAEIFRRYGAKLNDEQKADVRRLVREAQAQVEALRAFPLENSDEPATVLHLVGAPARSSVAARRVPAAAGAAKKPASLRSKRSE